MNNEKFLAALDAVHPLSTGLRAYLETILKTEVFKKNSKISLAEEALSYYPFIIEGCAKLTAYDPISERETCLAFWFENEFMSHVHKLPGVFLQHLHVQFLEETQVLTIAKKHVLNIFKLFPDANDLDLKLSALHLGKLFDQLYIRNYYTSSERYNMSLRLQPEIAKKIKLKDIATFLGVDNKTLSRVRSKK